MGKEFIEEVTEYFSALRKLNKIYAHGSNLYNKIITEHKENSGKIEYLADVFRKYRCWKEKSEELCMLLTERENRQEIMQKLVLQFNEYKDYIAEVNGKHLKYSAQSKFESSVLEEFVSILFRPLVDKKGGENYSIGSIRAYSNLYFSPKSFEDFKTNPSIKINQKDQDFAIYRKVMLTIENRSYEIFVPIVSMECKTYLDKTMLEGSIATAEKIKMGNRYCLFFIVTETYDVDYEVDPSYSRIDAIFVLRKQKRTRNGSVNPIRYEVVYDLYECTRKHIESDWSNIEENIQKYGRVI